MHTDGTLSISLLLGAGAILFLLLVWSHRRIAQLIPLPKQIILLSLRTAALILALLLAANPFFIQRLPDPEAFRIGIVADVSGSMHFTDTAGSLSRIEVVQNALDHEQPDSWLNQLNATYPKSTHPFSDNLLPLSNPIEITPGLTAIGDSLATLLNERTQSNKQLGAVALFTDGISQQGQSMFDVAKRYREAGIPLSVIGVGEKQTPGDLHIQFSKTPQEATLNDPFIVTAEVSNTFSKAATVEVGLFEKEYELERQTVTLPAQAKQNVSFALKPDIPGVHMYRVKIIDAPTEDSNPATDADFAAIEINEPEVLQVLYLGDSLNHTFRFLNMALRNDPQLELKSIIRLSEDRFFQSGNEAELDKDELPSFPTDPEALLKNSVLIIDTAVLSQLEPAMQEAVRNFLSYRGGGILFLGAPQLTPEPLAALLPVRQATVSTPAATQYLNVDLEPAFREISGGALFTPPGIFLARAKPAALITELSLGARPMLTTRAEGLPLMSFQAYGAGRSVYLGTQHTWQWRMESEPGTDQHRLFWRHLIGWLGLGGKPRVELPLQGSVQSLDAPLKLDLKVRGQDFRPSDDARITATLTRPDGSTAPAQTLIAQPTEPGFFEATTALDQPGEYRIDYRIDFPEGESLKKQAYFMGAFTGKENTDLHFRENELRDLARITGGEYTHYSDLAQLKELKLSHKIPFIEKKHYWTRHWLFLIALLAVLGLDWLQRRRIGLK